MPSPFPGMNPYLEHPEVWHDFHESFLPRMRELIDAQVGPDYLVKIEEHIYVHEVEPEEPRVFMGRSDVSVAERIPAYADAGSSASTAVLTAPTQAVPILSESWSEGFIEIRDRNRRSLITVIELLSPANKTGDDRSGNLAKRVQIMRSPAHFVEIDLLRGGARMPFEKLPPCDYYVMVSRAEERPFAGLWPLQLRDVLPMIPIPLKLGDADVQLNLQELLHAIHDAAGYAKYIYDNEIVPPLSPENAEWMKTLKK